MHVEREMYMYVRMYVCMYYRGLYIHIYIYAHSQCILIKYHEIGVLKRIIDVYLIKEDDMPPDDTPDV